MSHWYFTDSSPVGESLTLDADEARHLGKVMRARPGDVVQVLDGRGNEYTCELVSARRDAAELRVTSTISEPAQRASVSLGVALPKGERQRTLVEKCTELGVHALIPLATDRGVATPTDNALARLRRYAIEACKQSGRRWLPEIAAPCDFPDWLAEEAGNASFIAAPGGEYPPRMLFEAAESGPVQCAIGPEGGFTPEELEQAVAAGWRTLNLGPHVLRVETAALAVAALALAAKVDSPPAGGDKST